MRLAASPEEDVLADADEVELALHLGFPRVAVTTEKVRRAVQDGSGRSVPILTISERESAIWRDGWKTDGLPRSWPAYLATRLQPGLRQQGGRLWLDTALRDLDRIAGRPLPLALRGLGRRAMALPHRYGDLGALERLTGLSAGALKARFRRRSLESPFSYLRWFRALTVAHVLREPGFTTLHAAQRLGWETSANLCRYLSSTTGSTPTELRVPGGWERLLIRFVSELCAPEALEAWDSLDSLFLRRRSA